MSNSPFTQHQRLLGSTIEPFTPTYARWLTLKLPSKIKYKKSNLVLNLVENFNNTSPLIIMVNKIPHQLSNQATALLDLLEAQSDKCHLPMQLKFLVAQKLPPEDLNCLDITLTELIKVGTFLPRENELSAYCLL